MNSLFHCLLAVALLVPYSVSLAADPSKPGDTQILRWKDGKKAAFMLAFDDGCPSHLKHVIPELEKRKIPGTFYLNPAKSLFTNEASFACGSEAFA
jgi:peptidoglycan/xylan/chitin deacetylase (PgdA/CDA1 family)